MNSGYYTEKELHSLGFSSLGSNVLIDKSTLFVGREKISIGSNVRIDAFSSILAPDQGFLEIGSYVHIASYCMLSCQSGIIINNYSGLSHGVKIYSASDDYSGLYMTNPTIPEAYRNVMKGPVYLREHVIIGANTIVMPNIIINEGVAVGACSLVTKNLDAWFIYFGIPAKKLKSRKSTLLSYLPDLHR